MLSPFSFFAFQFNRQTYLDLHRASCLLELSCAKCQKVFTRKKSNMAYFRRQVRRHEEGCKGPKKAKQCPKCKKVFARNPNLWNHIKYVKCEAKNSEDEDYSEAGSDEDEDQYGDEEDVEWTPSQKRKRHKQQEDDDDEEEEIKSEPE